jgi:hypothetical protein
MFKKMGKVMKKTASYLVYAFGFILFAVAVQYSKTKYDEYRKKQITTA